MRPPRLLHDVKRLSLLIITGHATDEYNLIATKGPGKNIEKQSFFGKMSIFWNSEIPILFQRMI